MLKYAMATKRSRNKLERRAHMNIHHTIEVVDEVAPHREANFTRDRFGKKHEIAKKEPRDG